jgi:hypothetical protein
MLGFSPIAAAPLASTGVLGNPAVLAATEAKDTLNFSINNQNIVLAAVEAQDVTDFNFEIRSTASFAVTEAPDTFEGLLFFAILGYIEATEAQDTASFAANNQNIYFDLTEAPDVAAFNIQMTGTIAMSAVETPDSYSQKAYILWLEPDQPDDPTIWVPKNDPAPYLTTVI